MAVPGTAVIVSAVWLMVAHLARTTAPADPAAQASGASNGNRAAVGRPTEGRPIASRSPVRSGHDPVLNRHARRSCPPAASACADLDDHLTWLQSGGRITYGPVRMQPGASDDPTPRGIFHVAWKAGPHYISTSFGVPIPYAVFFAPGGIAFHAGSLTTSSHGCIHLTLRNARYFHDHLPIGAEVDVF
jgi:lipoprotein-anchoring transpeptidase ErfK/SrfK